jgi:polar amino acid transport system permease protein
MTDVDTSPPKTPAAIDAVPLRHPWRWAAAVVIVIVVGLFVYGAATNDAFRWHIFAKYVFNERVLKVGLVNTLQLTVYSMVLAIILGVILAVMRLSQNPVFKAVSWVYLWIFRGTPIYVQLVFWGLIPTIYANIQLGVPFGPTFFNLNLQALSIPFVLAILGLALNEAAYMAEIVRGGLQSVDHGQSEAAGALGMSRGQTLRRIVLPQAMRVIIPPTGNETISMLKTTSLVVVIGYFELMTSVQRIYSVNFQTIPLLIVAAIWYLALTSVLSVGQGFVERRYGRGVHRGPTGARLLPRRRTAGAK